MEQLLDLISDFNQKLQGEMENLDPEVSAEETLLHKLQELDILATKIYSELIDLNYNK